MIPKKIIFPLYCEKTKKSSKFQEKNQNFELFNIVKRISLFHKWNNLLVLLGPIL